MRNEKGLQQNAKGWLINMEQMELENHYSVTIIIKIESGKYYRWMLRVKEILMRNRVFTLS